MGKSWLSCALAQKACRDGYTVHYARVPRLFADLDLAHGRDLPRAPLRQPKGHCAARAGPSY